MDFVGIVFKNVTTLSSKGSFYEPLTHDIYDPETPDAATNNSNVIQMTLTEPCQVGKSFIIKFEYETDDEALGLNWVDASKTETNTPFMFTLCEDIYCRSLAPMMDTKKIKITYDAIVTVPSTMSVYTSADYFKHVTTGNNTAYYFQQHQMIAPNQIAIAIGELKESVM